MNATPKPTPSPATRAAIVALLRADPGVTATHRARILAAFDAVGERPKGLQPVSVVAASLGLSLPTVMRWIEAGEVAGRREGDRLTLVNREEVAAYASTRTAKS